MADPKIDSLQIYTEILSRAVLASKLGQQYGGDRDIYQALGYEKEISFEKYAARYSRQDMAKAVINRPIQYTWKGDLLVKEGDSNDETEFEKAWVALNRELKLKSKFIRLDKLTSIGKYGVLLFGFSDVTRKEDWILPVQGSPELIYLKPFSQGSATIEEWTKDTTSPRYGMPESYKIVMQNPGNNGTTELMVHHTRVLHVTGEILENETEGTPVLEPVYNRLMDLEKLVGGSAEMFWRGARPGYQGVLNKDYEQPANLESELKAQIDEYENNLRRIIVNEGVDLKSLAIQVSDPSNHVDVQIQMISAITGIPKRILTGSERGELSSTQDLTGWYSTIQTRREEYAEYSIVRPFIEKCQELNILPEVEDFDVVWADLFSASDKEKADVAKVLTSAIKEYASPGVEEVFPFESFLKHVMKFEQEVIEAIMVEVEAQMKEEEEEQRQNALEQPIDQPINQPVNQPVNQPINQPVNQPVR